MGAGVPAGELLLEKDIFGALGVARLPDNLRSLLLEILRTTIFVGRGPSLGLGFVSKALLGRDMKEGFVAELELPLLTTDGGRAGAFIEFIDADDGICGLADADVRDVLTAEDGRGVLVITDGRSVLVIKDGRGVLVVADKGRDTLGVVATLSAGSSGRGIDAATFGVTGRVVGPCTLEMLGSLNFSEGTGAEGGLGSILVRILFVFLNETLPYK